MNLPVSDSSLHILSFGLVKAIADTCVSIDRLKVDGAKIVTSSAECDYYHQSDKL